MTTPATVEIRPVAAGQGTALQQALALVRAVFDAYEAPEYSPEGIAEFYAYIEYATIQRALESGALWMLGAWTEGQLAGVIALRPPCHISLLFVRPAFHRRGIAWQLLQAALGQLRAAGQTQVTVHSSPYAVPVYQRLGFAATAAQQLQNGIRYTPMCLGLAQPCPSP